MNGSIKVSVDKEITVGIDISKNYLDVYVLELEEMKRFEYNSRGVRKLIKYLTSLNPSIVSMEYTAGLERNLIFAFQQ